YRQAGDKTVIVLVLASLGNLALSQGEDERAMSLIEEALGIAQEVGYQNGIAKCLEGLARLWMAQGWAERAVRLMAAAAGLRTAISSATPPHWRSDYQSDAATVRAQLGEEVFAAAWAEGRSTTWQQAIGEALRETPAG